MSIAPGAPLVTTDIHLPLLLSSLLLSFSPSLPQTSFPSQYLKIFLTKKFININICWR